MADPQYKKKQKAKRGKILCSSYNLFYLQHPTSSEHFNTFYYYTLLSDISIFIKQKDHLIDKLFEKGKY